MRTMRTFKPADYAIRGAFLGAVLIGGMLDLGHSAGTVDATLAAPVPVAFAATGCRASKPDTWWAEANVPAAGTTKAAAPSC